MGAFGCTVALFVVLSPVTEFGSLAPFAGFPAAGIAVFPDSVFFPAGGGLARF